MYKTKEAMSATAAWMYAIPRLAITGDSTHKDGQEVELCAAKHGEHLVSHALAKHVITTSPLSTRTRTSLVEDLQDG